ncbi:FtsW/RodA/SpoVE family cell cycle protein [Bifidobacterium leontopitheci]|uniref:Cell division protein FtsW n=1 Tax=Bifidobacterium leontopitheci TaxID=2650774 RepID=A0A6I1GCZ9_9BIFI|nr:FtsW/RodA/SpoVE family cell cycle protein [Bifidobacterium leontopitheci]KAB7789504.1 cell division protein FtsW [Bifidobacterium leontopitheci]
MILVRLRQASLLLLAMLISVGAFYQMFLRVYGSFPSNYIGMLAVVAALFLVLWGLLLKFKQYASQAILPCVLLLTAIGVVMIARIDKPMKTAVGTRQLIWLCVALVLCCLLVAVLRDYRLLRRYGYVNMVIGLALLLSPMVPGLGRSINGAKIWIGIGRYQLQPAEFAKLFLAFFFAAYLFDHRDQLAVGGRKVLGLQLPRIKDLGPIILVWVVCMGVLIMQRDLGTSLMFFAMFVAMLYAATGRASWLLIGFVAFAVGAVLAAGMFSHVGQRVDAWLHPFSDYEYNRVGGSWQLVTGIFGLAAGGMTGTGLGQGQPSLTTFANSDFIYTSVGEELGLTGLLAVLVLYLIIIASGFITAMKIKDGFGKLLASGLVFTMAFQVFTVVGGTTLVIPLTGMTMPYMAAGGSSLIANYVLAALLMVISHAANRPEPDTLSDTFQYEALAVLRDRELQERAQREAQEEREERRAAHAEPRHAQHSGAQPNDMPTEAIVQGGLAQDGGAAGQPDAFDGFFDDDAATDGWTADQSAGGAADSATTGEAGDNVTGGTVNTAATEPAIPPLPPIPAIPQATYPATSDAIATQAVQPMPVPRPPQQYPNPNPTGGAR